MEYLSNLENITTRLEEIGDEDPDMMLCLIGIFNDQSPALIEAIHQMYQAKDPQETRNAAHTLKGVCLNLGFSPISSICEHIEQAALSGEFEQVGQLYTTLQQVHQKVSTKLEELSHSVH